MPLRPPRLDDRGYADLVAELIERIPAHTPEWTNPRAGDPGRTLIELFGWLGDALLYRANLVPERQRLVFLRLLGAPLRPARPARGLVTVSLRANEEPVAVQMSSGATLTGPVRFEVRDEFTVLPVTAAIFYKRPEDRVPAEIAQALSDFYTGGGPVRTYVPTPAFGGTSGTEDPVDVFGASLDKCLWIALLAPRVRPEEQEARNELVRQDIGGRYLNVGVIPALAPADPLEPATARARVPHVWEMTVNTASQPPAEDSPWRPEYVALEEVGDGTSGLTRPGIVRLAMPRRQIIFAPTNDVRADTSAGVGDRPPRIDDAALASRLVAWIRLRPAPASSGGPAPETQFNTSQGVPSLQTMQPIPLSLPPPGPLRLAWAGINAVEAEQLVTYTNLIVGESDGTADQEFQLPATSIQPETLVLDVEGDGGWEPWTRVDDLTTIPPEADIRAGIAASRDAPAFQLDPTEGTVLFGDGVRGRVPPAGRRIRVRILRAGGGSAGNLPAGTVKAISGTTLNGRSAGSQFVVNQPLDFTGGADVETLAEAERRIPAKLRHQDRAVTAEDYRALARETPGVAVGRVELLPRFKPQQRFEDIPGVVTVMVLPDAPLAPFPNPRADRVLLETVYDWLDRRRPVATELYAIGCEYVPVSVSVAVTLAEGAQPDLTLQQVREAVRKVLWPLKGGGFDEQGWPLGRPLSNRELAVVVARVSGVSEVAGLNLFTRTSETGPWTPLGDSRDGREQNLRLERWQLPELQMIVAVADDTATGASLVIPDGFGVGGGTGGQGTNPFADSSAAPVAVPIVPDFC
jgi:predicted phage baseplate assembly protein